MFTSSCLKENTNSIPISDETDEDEIRFCHICYNEDDTDDDVYEECSYKQRNTWYRDWQALQYVLTIYQGN